MVIPPAPFDSRMESFPLRSISKPRVLNVAAGSGSFSRNHAEQAFSLCRISRTLSRARKIFWPCLPLAAKSSCTGSRGGLHPGCAAFTDAQGFTGRILGTGMSHGMLELSVAGEEAFVLENAFPESVAHNDRPAARVASGTGSAIWWMKFTPCGNAALP